MKNLSKKIAAQLEVLREQLAAAQLKLEDAEAQPDHYKPAVGELYSPSWKFIPLKKEVRRAECALDGFLAQHNIWI